MKETYEQACDRITRRIGAAREWVNEAEYLVQVLKADPRRPSRSGMIDALLGLIGRETSEWDRAQRNLSDAREELASACAEWDSLGQKYFAETRIKKTA